MQQYYFLFALAFLWTLFATVQDIRKREVANWLNFSLIAFALAYRAFYSITHSDAKFFLLGLSGFTIFFIIAHILYYSRAFAGGDAKLIMGFGIILPYTSYASLLTLPLIFVFTLFLVGAIYSIIYSLFIVSKNKSTFLKRFNKSYNKHKLYLRISVLLFTILTISGFFQPILFAFALLFLIPFLFIYTKSLDSCMIKLLPPSKLTEGDWLEKEVRIGKTKIKRSIHGLSEKDIKFLKKHKKSVFIKEGIPFVPAFLITLLIIVFVSLVLQISFESIMSSIL
jgi:Flp pilus assembly protein protease CpaA